MKKMGSLTMLRFEALCRISTVKKVQHWRGSSPLKPAQRTSSILAPILLVSSYSGSCSALVEFVHLSFKNQTKMFCNRSRGGSAQKDGVFGVCVPRPLWVLQVSEYPVPYYPNTTRKRLYLDPHRTHTGPHCQRVCQCQQLVGLWLKTWTLFLKK